MIFPILRGFLSPRLAPVTFLLFALNIFVFVSTLVANDDGDRKLDALLRNDAFIETQGIVFAMMIDCEENEGSFSSMLVRLADKSLHGDRISRRALGNLALRNAHFMGRAESYPFEGDEIALSEWRENFKELKEIQASHPTYLWGLSRLKSDWIQYVSYQFSHSGIMHLFWNMVFLLIFGGFVETRLGSSFVILAYLGGGLVGAFAFSKLSGISASPLVGASAAVSALIALVGFAWLRRERVRFFYWLLPAEGYFGFVVLPSWLVLFVSFLPDLSGYIGTARDFGSVAYSAHLGGTLWGVVMALALTLGVLRSEVSENGKSDSSLEGDAAKKAG